MKKRHDYVSGELLMKSPITLILSGIAFTVVAFTAQAQTSPVQEIRKIYAHHSQQDPSLVDLQGIFSGYCYVPKSCGNDDETKFNRVIFGMVNYFLTPDQDLPAPSYDLLKSIAFGNTDIHERNVDRNFVIDEAMSLINRDASALRRFVRRNLYGNVYEKLMISPTPNSPGSAPYEVRTYRGFPILKSVQKCNTGTNVVYCVSLKRH